MQIERRVHLILIKAAEALVVAECTPLLSHARLVHMNLHLFGELVLQGLRLVLLFVPEAAARRREPRARPVVLGVLVGGGIQYGV